MFGRGLPTNLRSMQNDSERKAVAGKCVRECVCACVCVNVFVGTLGVGVYLCPAEQKLIPFSRPRLGTRF